MMFDLGASFVVGLLGSLHCLGMCGPLVMAYSLHIKSPTGVDGSSRPSSWTRGISHHLAFHAGRILVYSLLGALSAGFFRLIGLNLYLNVRGGFILAGGGLIVLMGLVFLQVLPFPKGLGFLSQGIPSLWPRGLPALFGRPGAASKAVLGGACGLLPCCLSCSMLIKAALTENIGQGFMTMTAFGLGTFPALLAVGLSASLLTLRTRLIGGRLAALAVITMGLVLIIRGGRLLF
jgi:uncharacterized protein